MKGNIASDDSLVPRPPHSFCRLQYEKHGEPENEAIVMIVQVMKWPRIIHCSHTQPAWNSALLVTFCVSNCFLFSVLVTTMS